VNYENTNNFKILFSQQVPTQTILWMVFLSYANGIPLNTLETSSYGLNSGAQQAFLAYNAVIDPASADSNNTVYNSNVPGGGNYYQENTIITEGYNGKLSLMLQPLTKINCI
jgi:hypothetical protein